MDINTKWSLSSNYGGYRNMSNVKYIVIHYTANKGDTAKNNADYFARASVSASAHYFVDENNVWNTVPLDRVAWHCGGGLQGSKGHTYHRICTNTNSIGIEVCMNDKNGNVRTGSIAKALELTKYLMKKYGIPAANVIRHHDVTGKHCLPVDSTELLTHTGWKKLGLITLEDTIVQYDPQHDNLTYCNPIDIVVPYKTTVFTLNGFTATSDHRMFANCKTNNNGFVETTWGYIISTEDAFDIKTGYGLQNTHDIIMKHIPESEPTVEVCKAKGKVIGEIKTVSCVTVPTGYILVRQNGKTFVVGNCPAPMVDNPSLWTKFKNDLVAKPAPAPKPVQPVKTPEQIEEEELMKTYEYVKDIPDWARPTIQRLVNKGLIKPDKNGKICIREATLQPIAMLDQFFGDKLETIPGLINSTVATVKENAKVYESVDSLPDWAKDTFDRMDKAGAISHDAAGKMAVRTASIQTMVYLDRLTGGKIEKLATALDDKKEEAATATEEATILNETK